MSNYKKEFLDLAVELGVLRFGEFTLKSGRTSPYFFNAGLFNTGAALATLGTCYAQALIDSGLKFDMLFGPAYKGIPLAAVTAAALATQHNINVPYAFDRKEVKNHGEGGKTIGAPLRGRVVIVDDVITAGTAIGEAINIIEAAGGQACGALIAMNRQERGQGELSAIQELREKYELEVVSLVKLDDLIEFAGQGKLALSSEHLDALRAYRQQYGEKVFM
ncbi:MAG: orotate phosphoribosyltransferase [Gammaproteobacteria bacterium]|nr:orotate phosphoribosyltransferase [Gammaproteobacteria bacterium]